MNYAFLAAFTLYFFALLLIGIWFLCKNKSSDDFTIGSKSVNFWVSAIATQSSDMSSWAFMAFPAAVLIHGAKECWSAVGLLIFTFIMWHIIAQKICIKAEETHATSLIEIFAKQCNDKSHIFSIICALISVFFFTFYITAGLVGMGRLFEAAFAIDYHVGLIIGIITGLLYTLLGGFIAVAWSDFLQGIFLLIVIVLVPSYAFSFTSWQEITTTAFNHNISLYPINSFAEFKHALMLLFGWGLGYLGQPHLLTHFMSIKNKNNIHYAKYIAVAWQSIVLIASFFIGIISIGFFADTAILQPEFIFINMVTILFNPFIAGVMLCAIFAATLSSMDSQILIAGTNACTDLYQKIFSKDLTSDQIIKYSRYASIIISCIALAIAWHDNFSIYYLVNYAWSGLGAAFGPLTIATLFNWHIQRNHALMAITAGTLTTAFWPFINVTVLPLLPGFMLHLSILYLCKNYKK